MKRISVLQSIILLENQVLRRRLNRLPSVLEIEKYLYISLLQELQKTELLKLHGLKVNIVGTKGIRVQ